MEAAAGIGGKGAAQLQQMIDSAVAKALSPVVDDVEMLESSFEVQLKAALYRIKQLEAKLAGENTGGGETKPKTIEDTEEADERDEL